MRGPCITNATKRRSPISCRFCMWFPINFDTDNNHEKTYEVVELTDNENRLDKRYIKDNIRTWVRRIRRENKYKHVTSRQYKRQKILEEILV